MTALFWLSILLIFYAYFGYFLLLKIAGLFYHRKVVKGECVPSVSMIVCAYNEEKRIKKKIENCLELQYPTELLQLIVVSDASTDETDSTIKSYSDRFENIELVRVDSRGGKTHAQNYGMGFAKGEIVFFTDVSTVLLSNAVQVLVSNFNDQSVGLASGEDYWFFEDSQEKTPEGRGFYIRYEMLMRKMESMLGSTVNASGCCYGVRKALVSELKQGVVDDLAIPLMVVRNGYRVILDHELIARVPKVTSASKEFGRTVRIVVGGLTSFFNNLDLLNIFKYRFFSVQLCSHKLFRWLVPFFMISAFISNCFLALNSSIYTFLLAGQVLFYCIALAGYLLQDKLKKMKVLIIPYFLVSSNLSILVAWFHFLKGNRHETWTPSRT